MSDARSAIEAAPLVLIHGFAGGPASWDAVIAAGVVPAEVVTLPGHGDRAPVAASWDANLDAIAASIPAGAIAVGYSLGARVALGLLAGDRVAAAVLIGVNPGLTDAAERTARAASDAVWARRLRQAGIGDFVAAWQAQSLFASQARVPAAALAARRDRRLGLDAEGLARSLETMGLAGMPDYRPALRARADRAHLIVGGDDDAYLARARALRAEAPGLGLDVIAGSGHDPSLEQPAALALAIIAAVTRLRAG